MAKQIEEPAAQQGLSVGDVVRVVDPGATYGEYAIVTELRGERLAVLSLTGEYLVGEDLVRTEQTSGPGWAPPGELLAMAGQVRERAGGGQEA